MTDSSSLDSLQGLHQDLLALSHCQLQNVDRLWAELEARVEEFRRLLDKPNKSNASRTALQSGNYSGCGAIMMMASLTNRLTGEVEINGDKYALNQEFQENAAQLAEILNLDELESARQILEAQDDAEAFGRSLVPSAVIRFHQGRSCVLECLRLLSAQSLDEASDEAQRDMQRELLGRILEIKDGPARNGSLYIRKCLDAMADIEGWTQSLSNRVQGQLALGQATTPEFNEVLRFQQQSLVEQHESLGAIVNALTRSSFAAVDDFYKLLDHMPKIERWSSLVLHYIPILTAFTSEFGSIDRSGTLRDARMLDRKIRESRDTVPWPLRSLQAATITWWLAEYSGWYTEQPTGSPVQGVNFEEEAVGRSDAFVKALGDGAFQCTLSICSQIVPFEWYDPSRTGLIEYLLRDSPPLPQDLGLVTPYFREIIMEQFEGFVEAFITNMPDTLRNFKSEEDTQRKKFLGSIQLDGHYGASEQMLHLERFLVIISLSFDNREEAAQSFWSDSDSNLYGFLQWASKRQSTPYVGAFCEMLRAISRGEQCATSTHEFLLEESNIGTARIRRSSSLSWAQIFAELRVYVGKIREQPQSIRPGVTYSTKPIADDIDEPETVLMLQNYLRLMSHICRESSGARSWILSQQEVGIQEVLLCLCNTTIPSRLKACAFSVLSALLTTKSRESNVSTWEDLDRWVSGGFETSSNLPRPAKTSNPATWMEGVTFAAIARDFELASEFTGLLQSLVRPAELDIGCNEILPFPKDLGSSYRMPGIEPYIDLVLGKIFPSVVNHVEGSLEQRVLSWNVLEFIVICLNTFNENLVVLSNRSATSVDEAVSTSSLLTYVRLHPFCRVMDWLFSERVLASLFASTHQPITEVATSSAESPLMLSLIRGLEVMNLVMDLQSTYMDLVRPLVRSQATNGDQLTLDTSLVSFEESVASHLELVVDLGLYAGAGNQDLTIGALKLLEKLSSSRKLNVRSHRGPHGNRLIGALEQYDDLEGIARSLSLAMDFNSRELEKGPESPTWTIKLVILDFLSHCLAMSPERPSVAHAMLGFKCVGSSVDVELDGLFAKGHSLFHSVLHLVLDYPDGGGDTMQLWALSLRQKGLEILSCLWTSSLTAVITLAELRSNDLLFSLFLRQRLFDYGTAWDGRLFNDPQFMFTESVETFQQALLQRNALMEYSALEFRLTDADNIPSLKTKIFTTLLGTTPLPDGEQISHLTIFDLFDFAEFELSSGGPCPLYEHFAGLDFDVAIEGGSSASGTLYSLKLVEELVNLRLNELVRAGRMQDPIDAQNVDYEAMHILRHFQGENNQYALRMIRQQYLIAWSDLLMLAVLTCDLDEAGKTALTLQAFQLLTPKLEYFVSSSTPEATILASLIEFLLSRLDVRTWAQDRSRTGSVANDRLFQLFRVALRAVSSPGLSIQLREVLYSICHRYLGCTSEKARGLGHGRHGTATVKLVGEHMMNRLCDDAYGASASCRINALLLLESFARLAANEGSDHIIRLLSQDQFLQILVENIERMPLELRATNSADVPSLLVYYDCQLSLLLTISHDKAGAALLMDAGLFNAVRSSGLFSVDPDIGIEIDNSEALSKYYKLLLAITRVVTSIVLSRGPEHNQSITSARSFLAENRPLMVAILKRHAKIGGVSFDDAGVSIEELVELFVLLIAMTDFLKVCKPAEARI